MDLIRLTPRNTRAKVLLVNPSHIAVVTDSQAEEGGSYVMLNFPPGTETTGTVEVAESPDTIQALIAAGRREG